MQFLRNPGAVRVQCGALCWRLVQNDLKVLLVTSRDTGRWVIPKGWLIDGLTAQGSAAREAWEEAGVEGMVAEEPAGLYSYDKVVPAALAIPCIVSVFPLQVTRLRTRYPEGRQRQRKWFTPAKAARKVAEPGLRLILEQFRPLAAGALPAAAPPGNAGTELIVCPGPHKSGGQINAGHGNKTG